MQAGKLVFDWGINMVRTGLREYFDADGAGISFLSPKGKRRHEARRLGKNTQSDQKRAHCKHVSDQS